MFGKEWPPNVDTALAILFPLGQNRKATWAFGLAPKDGRFLQYIGGGQYIRIPGNITGTRDLIDKFSAMLGDGKQLCDLFGTADSGAPGWTIVARFTACVPIALAISDGGDLYGLSLDLSSVGLGKLEFSTAVSMISSVSFQPNTHSPMRFAPSRWVQLPCAFPSFE